MLTVLFLFDSTISDTNRLRKESFDIPGDAFLKNLIDLQRQTVTQSLADPLALTKLQLGHRFIQNIPQQVVFHRQARLQEGEPHFFEPLYLAVQSRVKPALLLPFSDAGGAFQLVQHCPGLDDVLKEVAHLLLGRVLLLQRFYHHVVVLYSLPLATVGAGTLD